MHNFRDKNGTRQKVTKFVLSQKGRNALLARQSERNSMLTLWKRRDRDHLLRVWQVRLHRLADALGETPGGPPE